MPPEQALACCFIDEILKGTNTVERLAASQAVLEELHRRDCICVAATHDLKLTQRLAGSYACYHFKKLSLGRASFLITSFVRALPTRATPSGC